MKKKFFTILLVILIILPAVPVSAAFDVFTGTLLAELDPAVNPNVAEWAFGDERASAFFSVNQESIIFMTFDEPISFTGNFAAILTDIPVLGVADAASTDARILSFIVDGNDLGPRDVPLVVFGQSGYMAFDLANADGLDVYGLAEMQPFSRLEISFIVSNLPAGVEDPEEAAAVPITEAIDPAPQTTPDTAAENGTEEADSATDAEAENDGASTLPGMLIGLLITALVAGLIVFVFRAATKKRK